MTTNAIPFNRPSFAGQELAYMADVIKRGHAAGDGEYTRRCRAFLEAEVGVSAAMLTPSCTHALEMSSLLLDIGPGDEVVVPSFTFVSSANAFALRGARPVFVDIRPDTLNLDERLLESALTPRTKAIVVVHYAGVGCNLDAIAEIAQRHGAAIVEDNAHGLFGRYRGRALGTFGQFAAQSFHETKNISCGEGGALLINDERYVARAEIIREKGTDRTRFFRGQIDKYTWVDIGSSYLPSELLAAFLWAQLECSESIQARRRAIWEKYDSELKPWASANGVMTPVVPEECEQPYHMYYLLMPSLESRTAFIDHLRGCGVMAVFHYLPLHLSKMGLFFGGRAGDCPVTEDVSDRLVRLPFFNDLRPSAQDRVIETACGFTVP